MSADLRRPPHQNPRGNKCLYQSCPSTPLRFREAIAANYISWDDISLSIERAYVRRDIMHGNFWHQAALKQFQCNLAQFFDKTKSKFNVVKR